MTTKNTITCSAPGSLMLLGEHAVLHGRRALVCAINKRITVSVFQTLEKTLKIDSALGTYKAPLDNLVDHPDFRFVIDVVKQYPLETGIELKIESEFSSDIGFGSSAAVTVATHAALMQLNSGSPGRFAPPAGTERKGRATPPAEPFLMELFKRSLATIHRVQGRGSGADVAASVFGGVVAYRVALSAQNQKRSDRFPAAGWKPAVRIAGFQPAQNGTPLFGNGIEILPRKESFPLTAVYSGSKMKTADVIRHLEERRALNADYFEKIFDRMDASVGEVISDFTLRESSGQATLGRNLALNQKLMEEMGLCNAALAEIISIFQTLETPAKISGSGLGDCAIGLGKVPTIGTFPTYALQVEPQGVQVVLNATS